MSFLLRFFHVILYQPLFNLLILFYVLIPGRDFGVAIIFVTILIKLALYPWSKKSIMSQQAMAKLQPKIKEIQRKYKDKREEQAKATMELYKTEKVSPVSGCLPLLLQLPILIALYQVFLNGFKVEALTNTLYSFVPFPGEVIPKFLGIIDLSRPFIEKVAEVSVYYWPILILALLTAAAQFVQMRMFSPKKQKQKLRPGEKPDMGSNIQSQMAYIFPAIMVYIVIKFGAIIGLYVLTSSIFAIIEHKIVKAQMAKAEANVGDRVVVADVNK